MQNQIYELNKRKTMGMLTIKSTVTQVKIEEENVEVYQDERGIGSGKGTSQFKFSKSDVSGIHVRTTFDGWNTGLALLAAAIGLYTGVFWTFIFSAVVLFIAYGKVLTISCQDGRTVVIPSDSGSDIDTLIEALQAKQGQS